MSTAPPRLSRGCARETFSNRIRWIASGNAIKKPGDTLALAKGDNPLTGPFFIEGAEPGDTLVVHILDLQVDSNQGLGAFAPGFGALNETNYTPMLHAPLP